MSDSIIISNFGKEDVNGEYVYIGDRNGYPAYEKSNGYLLIYEEDRMPYSHTPGYVLITSFRIFPSAAPTEVLPYLKLEDASNVFTPGWVATVPPTSGETQIGDEHYESSSSLSSLSSLGYSSSSSTSSSSSVEYSSSSSTSSSSSSTSSSSIDSSSSSSSGYEGIGHEKIGSQFKVRPS